MRTRTTAIMATIGLTAALSIAAHAPEGCYVVDAVDPETTEDDVFACSEQQYFHKAETLANTLGHLPNSPHGLATFDINPPAGSVTDGEGGGYFSTQAVGLGDQLAHISFSGSYQGVLDNLDIDLHTLTGIRPQSVPVLGDLDVLVDITLTVGNRSFTFEEVYLYAVPEESSQAGSMRLDFAITGLYDELKAAGIENGEDTVHDVTLKITEFPTVSGTVYAFDTTEVPGGINFNALEIDANAEVFPV